MDLYIVLAISLWVGIAGLDYYGSGFMIGRPIVTGSVVGLIMGDFQTGMTIGATLELAWLGLMPLAGAQPPNVTIGSAVGVVFGIQSGLDPAAVVGVAIPFAVFMQQLTVAQFSFFATLMNKADKYAENADCKGIERINHFGLITYFLTFFICAFIPVYFGDVMAKAMVEHVPAKVIGGLSIAGAMMPALGFAMILKTMLKEKRFAIYLVVGFVGATFVGMPIVAIALVGIVAAYLDYQTHKEMESVTPAHASGYEDGI